VKWLLVLITLFALPLLAAPKADDIAAYRALADKDRQLATVGYRLVAANAPFCLTTVANPGWVIHDIAQYPDLATAKAAFGGNGEFLISATIDGGAAQTAGLQSGDALQRLNAASTGVDFGTIARSYGPKRGYRGMDAANAALSALFGQSAGQQILVTFRRDGIVREATLTPVKSCASGFYVDTRDKVDAGADGTMVRVTSGLMNFVGNDTDQLAAAVAHELSHNLLNHRAQLESHDHTNAKTVLQTEIEADRLSVWLMANAGFDTSAAPRFAERFGRKFGMGIFNDGTHPRWKDRVASMREEIGRINAARNANDRLDPPLLSTLRNRR
jgi:beta-barrel assembly-enhancing protease